MLLQAMNRLVRQLQFPVLEAAGQHLLAERGLRPGIFRQELPDLVARFRRGGDIQPVSVRLLVVRGQD